jgi:flagellar motility protein MotE (MotC chaperone)
LTALSSLKEYEEIKEKYATFKAENEGLEENHPEFLELIKKNNKNLTKYYREQRAMYSKVLG